MHEDREVPDERRKAIIIVLHKGKDKCNNYRGISLLSVPRKLYGRVLTGRLMKVNEGKLSEEQGGFRKGKVYV